ncbi:MAG: adenosylmethionine--8-amino-7-oxononanoate transaminase [Flavipsychrobacter sp.]|nr:adenosylmethionine--8-amino-7-oxononanoate transaminase [Flavipsychrobacter sp.]
MATIKERDSKVIWHPYTPMKAWPEAIAIVKGEGLYLIDEDGDRYMDAISSWWVNLHGHSHPYIAQKVHDQMMELEHCIFAGFTHEPAVRLAERLLEILPANMKKIFYSDNGSTAVEVAIKMALQYWNNKGFKKKKLVALQNAYHGDTFGAMAVSGRSIFTEAFTEFLFDVEFVPFPAKGKEGESIATLKEILQKGDVAAFIIEPLVQGSAGMYMYTPDVLDQYFRLCRKFDALIIADEVMTGFGRTGPLFACDQIDTMPDMVCLSKGLTGGAIPMGITACSQAIYDAFYDDDRMKMLYHGHSFTANPTTCAAALASLDLLLTPECEHSRKRIETAHAAFAQSITGNPVIKDVRQMGTIIAIELNTGSTAYHSNIRDMMYLFFRERKIVMRPLGSIIYILPPYCITNDELQHIYDTIKELISRLMAHGN